MAKVKTIELQSDLLVARKLFEANINKVCEFVLKEDHCTVYDKIAIKENKTKLQGIILKVQNKHVICKRTNLKEDKKFIVNDLFMVLIYDIISYKIL